LVRKLGFPESGDCVVVTVIRITPNAAWCRLEEYPNKEGMIHVSEVSGKWVRDIRKFVKLNKTYVAKVLRVDKSKGYINLSLKRIDKTEKRKKMQEYKQEQRCEKILELTAKEFKKSLNDAYKEVGYLLQENYGSLHAGFEEILKSKEMVEEVPRRWTKKIYEIMMKSFEEKENVLIAELELKCFERDGIEKIKKFLLDMERDSGVKTKYISAPRYRVELKTKDPKSGEKELIEILNKKIKNFRGEASFKIIT